MYSILEYFYKSLSELKLILTKSLNILLSSILFSYIIKNKKKKRIKMVDENLAKDLVKMKENGTMSEDPKNMLKLMELIKQVSLENEDLIEELESMDEILAQMVITDKDFKWWIKLGDGKFSYGEGEDQNASFSMLSDWKTLSGVMTGEIDGTVVYMSGTLKMEGNVQDTMAFGDYFQFAMEILEELGYWKLK